MKLTGRQLRNIIREEYSFAKKNILTEAEAYEIADHIIEEGLLKEFNFLTVMKAKLGGAMAGAKSDISNIGIAAGKGLGLVVKTAKNVAAQAKSSVAAFNAAMSKIDDDALKAAVEKEKEIYKSVLQGQLKKNLANSIKNLTSAGMSKDEATAWASGLAITVANEINGAPSSEEGK